MSRVEFSKFTLNLASRWTPQQVRGDNALALPVGTRVRYYCSVLGVLYHFPLLTTHLSFVFLVKICSENDAVPLGTAYIFCRNFSSKILCLNEQLRVENGIS